MKLQHLAVGARFEYEGVVYVKTGPLTASSEQGGARIIPRSATLKPVDLPLADGKREGSEGIDLRTVRTAFDIFFETCNRLVDQDRREALAKARNDFLASLK